MCPLILTFLASLTALGGPPGRQSSLVEVVAEQPLPGAKDAELVVEVQDAESDKRPRPLPVRVVVTASDGSHPDGSGHGTYADGRFFAEGKFSVRVPPGETRVVVKSGPNYLPLDFKAEAKGGHSTRLRVRLYRWFAPEERGWYAGDNHVHAQHDAKAVVKTGLAYTALQARANGLSYLTEAGSEISYDELDKLDRPGFLFRFAPEVRPGPFVGHLNTPGVRNPLPKELHDRLTSRPLPAQALAEAVHDLGGAVIRTHPLTPPHQLHWMGATEVLSDAVMARCGDALDLDSRATELLWFAALNLGNRVAASGSTDAALGRLQTPSPGDRRVYCQAKELTYPGVVKALREGRTFATNGGPVFPFLTIDGREPGDVIPAGEHTARIELHSLHPLRSAVLYRRGKAVRTFDVKGKKGRVDLSHAFRETDGGGWYVFRAEDESGHWAVTSPVYVARPESGRGSFASAVVLGVGNYTRFIELRRDFYWHLIVTVSPGGSLTEVQLLRDGKPVKTFTPADGNELPGGKVPVTGKHGEYQPGWVWNPGKDRGRHFQADWPAKEGGWYQVRARTAAGKVIESDAVHFDARGKNSRALSVATLAGGGDTRFTLWGYGEEMPLEEVRVPFRGDHWWYPRETFWRVTAEFAGQAETVGGGANRKAAALFRAGAKP